MKKIIFLDIDGVLNTSYSRQKNVAIDEFRLVYLAEIVKRTKSKIVLTSTWRYNLNRTFLGFRATNNSTKTLLALLKKYRLKINDTLPLSSHLLLTMFNGDSEKHSGLTEYMVKRACQIIENNN